MEGKIKQEEEWEEREKDKREREGEKIKWDGLYSWCQ